MKMNRSRHVAPCRATAAPSCLATVHAFGLATLVAVSAATAALAADRVWIGATGRPAGDGVSFAGSLNWAPTAVPGPADRAIFETIGGEILLPGGLVVNERLLILSVDQGVFLDLAGGLYRLTSPSSVDAARSIIVGSSGSTLLGVANGSIVGQHVVIGTAGGDASVDVLSGASFQSPASLLIGEEGSGMLTVEGELLSGPTRLGDFFGFGTLSVESPAAIWIALGNVSTGLGNGQILLSNGALAALASGLDLAPLPGGDAEMTVGGLGTTLFVGGDVAVAGSPAFAGGGATLTIEDFAIASTDGALVLWPAGSVIVKSGARFDTAAFAATGGTLDIADQSALIVDSSGAVDADGFAVGVGPGSNVVEIVDGASVQAPSGAFGSFPGGVTVITLTGSTMEFAGDLGLGWPSTGGETNHGGATLLAQDGAALDVGGTLTIGERARLALDASSVGAGALAIDGRGVLDVILAVTPNVSVDGPAALAGGLFIGQSDPGFLPGLNTVYTPVVAAGGKGTFAVILARPLPGYRFYQPLASDGVQLEVDKLDSQIGLAEAVPAELPGAPNWIVADQFDADAFPDALVTVPGAEGDPGEAALLLNGTGDDGPGFRLAGTLPVGAGPAGIATTDVDGDGRLDAVVANEDDGTLSIVLNNLGAATGPALVSGGVIPVGGRPRGIAAADLFGSGRDDLVWADRTGSSIFVAPSNGKGGWSEPQAIDSGPQPGTVNPIDLDDDKDLDLAVVNFGAGIALGAASGSSVSILSNQLSQKQLGFAPAVLYPVGDGAIALAGGDLNGDGAVDLVTANELAETISVLINRGDGSFLPAVDLPVGGRPTDLALGDFDNDDGKDLDIAVLVVHGDDQSSLTLFRNDSAFGQTILTILENADEFVGLPAKLASSDVDGDGPVDLIFVGSSGGPDEGGFISIVPTVPLVCPADIDGDGLVNGSDIGALLGLWGPVGGGTIADLNDDGTVNGVDLALLLADWAPCPTGLED